MVPPPEKCEETSWQSKQKHAFLEAYLRIWTDHVGKRPGATAPSLNIYDLFASYGWCYSPDNRKTWEGTAVVSATHLNQYQTKYGRLLYLNSYNADASKQKAQLTALRENIDAVGLDKKVRLILDDRPLEESITAASATLDPRYPSLWILDPYKPQDLPWTEVERIMSLSGSYGPVGKEQARRPELFINLMTHSLQRNLDKTPDLATIALGLPETEWRPRVQAHRDQGLNLREAIARVYAERLEQYYGKPPLAIEVRGTDLNIVYVVFFCTQSDAAFYMMLKEGVPKYQEWQEMTWKPAAKEESKFKKADRAAQRQGQRQKRLD